MNRISHFGTIYNLDKLVTLGGIYTELTDSGNALRMSPADGETEPSTVFVALSKGMKVDGNEAYPSGRDDKEHYAMNIMNSSSNMGKFTTLEEYQ